MFEIGTFHENEVSDEFLSDKISVKGRRYGPRPDILIRNKNLVIEIYGDYWHANPNRFKSNDLILIPWHKKTKVLVSEIWAKDKERSKIIKEFGYQIVIIWESQVKDLSFKNILHGVIDDINIKNQ